MDRTIDGRLNDVEGPKHLSGTVRRLFESVQGRARHNRHRFATMTLLRWYRSGEDVERRLPFLSAYLGHVHVSDTFWNLSAWPELMQQAMARLERCWEGQS